MDKTLTKNDKFKFLSYNCAITNKQNNMHELMKSTLLISNEAINGSYDYTPLEIDLMIHIINAAVKETDQNKKCHLRFTYGQLMDDAQGNDYNQLRAAFLSLLKKPYEIYYKDTSQYFAANLITAVTINKNSGFILVDLHPKILQLITDIRKNYTSFETRSVLSLKSKYAKRLYLMCCQFKNTGVKYTSVEDFRKSLKLVDKYENFADLKKRVLEPAVKEITAVTDLAVNYELEKTARRYENLVFSVALNKEAAQLYGNDKQIMFMRQCGLSEWQIENTLQTLSPSELHPILYSFNLNKQNIKNKGAYLAKCLNDAGVPMKTKLSKQLGLYDTKEK